MELDLFSPEPAQAGELEPALRSRWLAERRAAVRVTGEYDASPERVFDAWLDPAMASTWLFATASRPIARVEIDARVGGAFRFVDRNGRERTEYTGVYVEIARPRRLVFTLSMESNRKARSRVAAEIVPRHGGCALTLTHEDLPPDQAARIEARWTGILYGLGVKLVLAARASALGRAPQGRRTALHQGEARVPAGIDRRLGVDPQRH